MAIGNSQIKLEDFEQLIDSNAPLIRWNGTWFKIPSDKKKQLLDLIQRTKEKKTISLGQALRMVLGKERVPEGFQIIGLESSGILQSLLDRLLGKWNLEKIDQPTAFQGNIAALSIDWLVMADLSK